MKGLKKLLTGVLAATMIMSASITAFAMDDGTGTELNPTAQENPAQNGSGTTTAASKAKISVKHTVVKGAEDREVTYTYYQVLKAENITDLANNGAAQTGKAAYYTESDAMAKFLKGTGLFDVADKTAQGRYYVAAKANVKGEDITAKFYVANEKNEYSVQLPTDTAQGTFKSTKLDGIDKDKDREVTATSGDLDLGYYLVISDLGTVAALQTLGDVTINEKNTFPGVTKTKASTPDIYAMFGIGSALSYEIKVEIPASVANKPIKVVDTATKGLTLDPATNAIAVTGGVENFNLTWGTPTATTDGSANVYETTIDAATVIANAGKTLTLTYSATINEKAVVFEPESNTAHIEYENYKSAETEPVEVKTIGIGIFKFTTVNGQKKALTGAEFSLWNDETADADTNKIKVVQKLDENNKPIAGAYRVAKAGETGVNIVVDANGNATIDGLEESNSYWLQEEVAPIGFNKLTARQHVIIDTNKTAANQITYVEVENNSGSVLPSTGGIGTTIFYVLGGILIVAGVAYFILRRKSNAQ